MDWAAGHLDIALTHQCRGAGDLAERLRRRSLQTRAQISRARLYYSFNFSFDLFTSKNSRKSLAISNNRTHCS
jgi:hypothetical protein